MVRVEFESFICFLLNGRDRRDRKENNLMVEVYANAIHIQTMDFKLFIRAQNNR